MIYQPHFIFSLFAVLIKREGEVINSVIKIADIIKIIRDLIKNER